MPHNGHKRLKVSSKSFFSGLCLCHQALQLLPGHQRVAATANMSLVSQEQGVLVLRSVLALSTFGYPFI